MRHARRYRKALGSTEGEGARRYLRERGIDDAAAEAFDLGLDA